MSAKKTPEDIVKSAAGVMMPNLPVVSELTVLSGSSVEQGERRYRSTFKKEAKTKRKIMPSVIQSTRR